MKCTECGSSAGRIIRYKRKKPYCWQHYLHMNRHGRILRRTKYTPNEFIIAAGSTIEIVLYGGERVPIAKAFIDAEDFEKVRQYKWHVAKRRGRKQYCETIVNGDTVFLHTLVLGTKIGFEIDHRNGNGLDDRKSNLRHVTHHQNILNVTPPTSGRLGVWWRPERKKWQASIMHAGKSKKRLFVTFEDAVACRQQFERDLLGTTVEELRGGTITL